MRPWQIRIWQTRTWQMRRWQAASGAAALLMAVAAMTAARADDVLKICLDEELPPSLPPSEGAWDHTM